MCWAGGGSLSRERNSMSAGRWSSLRSHRFRGACEHTARTGQSSGTGPLVDRDCRHDCRQHAAEVAWSSAHGCLWVPTESQRGVNRQRCWTLPVLAGLPSYSGTILRFVGRLRYSHWVLIISKFQIPLQIVLFDLFVNGCFLFKWSQYAFSLGAGIIISFKDTDFW